MYSIFMVSLVYPVVVHALWSENGFLSNSLAKPLLGVGALDYAGGAVVHYTGGVTALVATWVLGARKGRFTNSKGELLDKPKDIAGHSVSLQAMGTLVLWFGCKSLQLFSLLLLSIMTNP
jgi:Amt family ammonium transporter